MDLGRGIYATYRSSFNPSALKNLFDATNTLTLTNIGAKTFVELDFSDKDRITLKTGHSYAFGLLSTGDDSDLVILRSGGGPSDTNGAGFTLYSMDQKWANVSAFTSNGVRNVFVGIYTVPLNVTVIYPAETHLVENKGSKDDFVAIP